MLLSLRLTHLLTTDTVWVTGMALDMVMVTDTQHTDMVTPDTHTDTLERDQPMPSQKPRLMLLLKPMPLLTTDTVLVTDMVWDTDVLMDTQHMDTVTPHTHTDTLERDQPMLSQKPRLMPLLMLTMDMDMATTHKPMVMVMATPMVVTVDTTMDKELKNVETIFFQNCF